MFGQHLYHARPFGYVATTSRLPEYIEYNGKCLNDGTTYFTLAQYLAGKEKSYDTGLIDVNEGVLYNPRELGRQIVVEGIIKTTDRAALLGEIDSLQYALSTPNSTLLIYEGGVGRKMKASCVKREFTEDSYNRSWTAFVLTFLSYDFSQSVSSSATFSHASSAAVNSFTIVRDGNAETKTYTRIVFTGATGVTSVALDIDGVSATITGTFSAGDVVIFDGYNILITKNGNSSNFSGIIPKIKSATPTITITTNGSARAYTMTFFYFPAYR